MVMQTSSLSLRPVSLYHKHLAILVVFTAFLMFVGAADAQTTTATSTATTMATTTPPAPAPVPIIGTGFSRDLEISMSSTDVTALQTYLALDTSLYPEGLITGYFGPLTQAAVTRFQAQNGIDQVGRVGPITRAKLNSLLGLSNMPSIPPFGIGGSDDMSAPTMTATTVTPSSNSAAISWTTNEPAWSRVMYGAVWPFLYSAAPKTEDPSFDSSASVTLTNLTPNTTYYFVRKSEDAAGNIMLSAPQQFHTL